jgi:peptidoglycan/LPS O-acetylase OafA/YrhL
VAPTSSSEPSAFLYLFPDEAIDIWPWPLTWVTARMLGAIFALGLAGLGAWRERRWRAARILVQVAGIMVLLILVAGIHSRHEFDASNALTWPFAAGFCVTAAGVVILYLRMELSANR